MMSHSAHCLVSAVLCCKALSRFQNVDLCFCAQIHENNINTPFVPLHNNYCGTAAAGGKWSTFIQKGVEYNPHVVPVLKAILLGFKGFLKFACDLYDLVLSHTPS